MSDDRPVLVTVGRGGKTAYMPTRHLPGVTSTRKLEFHDEAKVRDYAAMGVPIVDTRTIPEDRILKWALYAPMVDIDLRESKSVKVEPNTADLDKGEYALAFNAIRSSGHPELRLASVGNLGRCTVADYIKLAREWGATIHNA